MNSRSQSPVPRPETPGAFTGSVCSQPASNETANQDAIDIRRDWISCS